MSLWWPSAFFYTRLLGQKPEGGQHQQTQTDSEGCLSPGDVAGPSACSCGEEDAVKTPSHSLHSE